MALVAVVSVKGAPGATTLALAMSAVWPGDRPLVFAETDPSGGDVAGRFGLRPEPGLVTLAAACRHAATPSGSALLLSHCQEIPGGLKVLASPPAPAETSLALAILAERWLLLADHAQVDLVADCGRLPLADLSAVATDLHRVGAGSVHRELAQANSVVLVCRGDLSHLAHVEASLPGLRRGVRNVTLVVVGPSGYSTDAISRTLDVEVIEVPVDIAGAAILAGEPHRGSGRRLPLFRAAATLVDALVSRLEPLALAGTVTSHDGDGTAAAEEAMAT